MKKSFLLGTLGLVAATLVTFGASSVALASTASVNAAAERKQAYANYSNSIKTSDLNYKAAIKKAQQDRTAARAAAKAALKKALADINTTLRLKEGEITLQGTYAGKQMGMNPDVGGTMYLKTSYGQVNVTIPGFIMCPASNNIFWPTTVGEKVEVRGNYRNGRLDVCTNTGYYVKEVK